MEAEERQFMLTAGWLFMRHGRPERAKCIFEALCEEDSQDGAAALALAKLLLDEGDATKALALLRGTDVPDELAHAAAVLETRALRVLRRGDEAESRWNRYLESRKGAQRKWIA